MRQQRRADRRRTNRLSVEQRRAGLTAENRAQKAILLVVVIGLLIVLVVLAIGFYRTRIAPPGKIVAETTERKIELRELVPILKLLTVSAAIQGNPRPPTPRSALDMLVRNSILNERANPAFGVDITSADVDLMLVSQFEPEESFEGKTPVVLTDLGEGQYKDFLKRADVTDQEYREFLNGELYFTGIRTTLGKILPEKKEQVLLNWIVVSNIRDARAAIKRLDAGEKFSLVVKQVSQEERVADENGQIGWVPKGIFTELDDAIFALKPGEYTEPIKTSFGIVIALVSQGPEENELEERMRSSLAERQGAEWFQAQLIDALIDYNLEEQDFEWVVEQLR